MEYGKDFDNWNLVKKEIDNTSQGFSFVEKEIWMCSIGVNVGSEEDGKGRFSLRPIYILKKINHRTFIGIPLTSRLRSDSDHVALYFNYDISTAIISQIRNYDKKRLFEKMGIVSDYLHSKIKKATVAYILGVSPFSNDAGRNLLGLSVPDSGQSSSLS
jgi:mRNA-degrading endonuclease toxin of MazEF toxin-antitoxin module